jgi:hypothetical protein
MVEYQKTRLCLMSRLPCFFEAGRCQYLCEAGTHVFAKVIVAPVISGKWYVARDQHLLISGNTPTSSGKQKVTWKEASLGAELVNARDTNPLTLFEFLFDRNHVLGSEVSILSIP